MKGTFSKFLKQILWLSPQAHLRQIFRNAINPTFWKYNFRSHPLVKRHILFFWRWYSFNRDFVGDACPGWQFWYYELKARDMNDKEIIFKNYRKFPLIHTAIDGYYVDGDRLFSLRI